MLLGLRTTVLTGHTRSYNNDIWVTLLPSLKAHCWAGLALPSIHSTTVSAAPEVQLQLSFSFQVGPRSTLLRTQCLCNHLTYFGSDFFIVPRTVDVKDTVKLFLQVTNNPVGVSLLASLLGLYLLLFIWAWRKDQEDRRKVISFDFKHLAIVSWVCWIR